MGLGKYFNFRRWDDNLMTRRSEEVKCDFLRRLKLIINMLFAEVGI